MREVQGDPQRGRAFAKRVAQEKGLTFLDVRIRFRLGIEGKGALSRLRVEPPSSPLIARTLTEGSSHWYR